MKDKLINNLKNAKVPRNKKWIYSLIAWTLDNQDKPYQNIQRRINISLYHNKGYYKDYYEVNKVKHNEKMKANYHKNPKHHRIKHKEWSTKGHRLLKLYNEGKLSKDDTKRIEKEFKKIKKDIKEAAKK